MKIPKLRIKPSNIVLISANGDQAELCCHFKIPSKLASKILIYLVELGMVQNFNVRERTYGVPTIWDAQVEHEDIEYES